MWGMLPWEEREHRERLEAQNDKLREALDRIVNSGQWYSSALEIDLYKEGAVDGEELERMARAALEEIDNE